MYKKFFGLKENPFNVNPDPRYLFLTQHTQEALACLTYGIETRKGFILLTGEVGTGKTTLINKLLEWLHKERVSTAFVFNPRLSVSQFFDFMMADFGIPCESRQKGPDADEAESVAARALPGRGARRADRGRGAEPFAADAGRNSPAHQSGNVHRKAAADRARRAARTRTESSTSPSCGNSASASRCAPKRASSRSKKPAATFRSACASPGPKIPISSARKPSKPCTATPAEFPASPICCANMRWSAHSSTRRIPCRRRSSKKWRAISTCT